MFFLLNIDSAIDELAIRFILIATIVLFLITAYLFVASILVRNARLREEHIFQKKRDFYYPLILGHMVGEEIDLSKIEKSLRSRDDFIPYTTIIYELMDSVDGSEVDRLKELMQFPKLRKFYNNLLYTRNTPDQTEACLFYAQAGILNDKEYRVLVNFLKSKNLLLVHAASQAIMSSDEVKKRFVALQAVCRRHRVSRLAILDMLYLFNVGHQDQMDEETVLLAQLIKDKNIPEENTTIIIKGICDIGYVSMAMELYELIESGEFDYSDIIVEALIYAMGRFQFGPALETIIRKYPTDPRPRVRRACAVALEMFMEPEYAPVLVELANDPEFAVRVKAVYALASLGKEGQSYLANLSEQTMELRHMIRNIVAEVEGGR